MERINHIDLPESDYLYLATSQIPNAGTGLFTAVDIFRYEIIAIFKGEVLTPAKANKRSEQNLDRYFIDLRNGKILDSMNADCFAKYANDAEGPIPSRFKNNVRIVIDENGAVCLEATKKIKASEELFCGYGKRYWKKHGLQSQ